MRLEKHVSGLMAGVLSCALLAGAVSAKADEGTKEAWRLFVTDQEKGQVTAINAADGKILDVFPTSGYVTHLVPSESGSTLFAVQMDHDMVHVINSGIKLSDHGDHGDIEIEEPSLLPVELAGKRPIHVVPHGKQMIQFYDREGVARIYDEDSLLEGKTDHEEYRSTAPVHGVAVPMGDYMLMAEPDLQAETKPEDLPPLLGVSVLDKDGKRVGETETCSGLHGEASSAGIVAFGCAEGVLLAEAQRGATPKFTMLAYDEAMPEGRVGTLLGGKAMQFFLGNYGSDHVVVIEPGSDKPYRMVKLPVRRVDFTLDLEHVTTAYIFTEDGKLHALDILSGEITRTVSVTGPYSKDGHWRNPRPRLAVMGDEIAITDPNAELVRVVSTESFEEVRTIPVKGLPFNIRAVGGSGMSH
jgi:hypothetical protein